MATYGKKLLDINGNIILPKTRSSLVYMDDNSTVEDKISSILSEITKIKDGSTIVGKAVAIRDANKSDKKYGLYGKEGSTTPTSSTAVAIWDSQLSVSRPIERAVQDKNGKVIDTTYMKNTGGTFTGGVNIGSVNYGKTWAIRNCNPRTSAGAEVSGIANFFFYRK